MIQYFSNSCSWQLSVSSSSKSWCTHFWTVSVFRYCSCFVLCFMRYKNHLNTKLSSWSVFRVKGTRQWKSSPIEKKNLYQTVSGLDPRREYEIRMVAKNGEYETSSKVEVIPASEGQSNLSWGGQGLWWHAEYMRGGAIPVVFWHCWSVKIWWPGIV